MLDAVRSEGFLASLQVEMQEFRLTKLILATSVILVYPFIDCITIVALKTAENPNIQWLQPVS